MTVSNITKTVMKGFGTGVGGFSNTATILYAMAAIFNKPEDKDKHDELLYRIKLLREIVGQEIDRIKGADKPSLPADWKKYETINPDDSDDEKARKIRHNSLVISKKPYFFRYLYPGLNQRYKQFENSYNEACQLSFHGLKLKQLLRKQDKTPEELAFVRNYQHYSPLITSDCTMNFLCREFENVDFDIKFRKNPRATEKNPVVSKLPTYEEEFATLFSKDRLDFVRSLYKSYNSRRQLHKICRLLDDYNLYTTDLSMGDQNTYIQADEYLKIRASVWEQINLELQAELTRFSPESPMSGREFLFYCNHLSKEYDSFNWSFAWDILSDQILELIPRGISRCPIHDDENGTNYLGSKYILKELFDITDDQMEAVIDSITPPDDGVSPITETLDEVLNSESSAPTSPDLDDPFNDALSIPSFTLADFFTQEQEDIANFNTHPPKGDKK